MKITYCSYPNHICFYYYKIPPKPAPKPKVGKQSKNTTLKLEHQQSSGNMITSEESLSTEEGYEMPIDPPEGDYAGIYDVYEETGPQNLDSQDESNYTELSTTYTPANPQVYEKYITEDPKAKKVSPPALTPFSIAVALPARNAKKVKCSSTSKRVRAHKSRQKTVILDTSSKG